MKKLLLLGWLFAAAMVMAASAARAEDPVAPGGAGGAANQQVLDSLERARSHLKQAFEELGVAGETALEQHAPAIREKTGQTVEEAIQLMKTWEERLKSLQLPPTSPPSQGPLPPPPGTGQPAGDGQLLFI